jgi:hypothetical protein
MTEGTQLQGSLVEGAGAERVPKLLQKLAIFHIFEKRAPLRGKPHTRVQAPHLTCVHHQCEFLFEENFCATFHFKSRTVFLNHPSYS